jgi:hypothetical protein
MVCGHNLVMGVPKTWWLLFRNHTNQGNIHLVVQQQFLSDYDNLNQKPMLVAIAVSSVHYSLMCCEASIAVGQLHLTSSQHSIAAEAVKTPAAEDAVVMARKDTDSLTLQFTGAADDERRETDVASMQWVFTAEKGIVVNSYGFHVSIQHDSCITCRAGGHAGSFLRCSRAARPADAPWSCKLLCTPDDHLGLPAALWVDTCEDARWLLESCH